MGQAPQELTLPDGLKIFHHDKSNAEFLHREIFEQRVYARNGLKYPDGGVYFDIGANIGLFSVFVSRQCRPAAIYSFEPIPETFAVLSRNAEQHFPGCGKVYRMGVAAQPQTAEFTYTPVSYAGASMYPDESAETHDASRRMLVDLFRQSRKMRYVPGPLLPLVAEGAIWMAKRSARKVTCQLTTLEAVIEENQVTQIDLAKIDAEGCEVEILESLKPSTWPKIAQLVIEVHKGAEPLARIQRLLESHGFSTEVEPDPWLPHSLLYALRK